MFADDVVFEVGDEQRRCSSPIELQSPKTPLVEGLGILQLLRGDELRD
jgi:hypothetical protein